MSNFQITSMEEDHADYHFRQFQVPYRSTIAFCEFIEKYDLIRPDSSLRILDVGSGLGANIAYMSSRYPDCSFTGFDNNRELVEIGNQYLTRLEMENCQHPFAYFVIPKS